MFSERNFNALLAKHGKKKSEVADLLGISVATLYRKIKGISDFTRQEIQIIKLAFSLSDEELNSIFFAEEVTET